MEGLKKSGVSGLTCRLTTSYKKPERYATINKDNVISFENRELFEDPLTDLIRSGARQLIALGVEAELDELMAKYAGQDTETGRQAVVRSGYHRQRQIQTGIGAVTVKIPRCVRPLESR